MNQTAKPIPTAWASAAQLAANLSVSRATVWRWAAEGRIPRPVKFSPGCSRWNIEAVQIALEGGRQ